MKIKGLVLAVLSVLLMSGCADIKRLEDLKAESFKLEGVTPYGLRGLTLNLAVKIDNPGAQVALSEISGELKHSGKVLGRVAVDPFVLQGKASETYHLKADVTLGENASVFDLGKLLGKAVTDEATVDLSAKVKIRKGPAKKLTLNDIPLKKLIETVK
jgi:hypothetical protein